MLRAAADEKGFLSILGLIFALCLVGILFSAVMKTYFGKLSPAGNVSTNISQAEVGAGNYQSVISQAKNAKKAVEETAEKQLKQLEQSQNP